MKLIPAPGRQFKTVSMILLILIGAFDLSLVLLQTLADVHMITVAQLAVANAAAVFTVGVVRLVHQQVAYTTSEKVEAVEAVAAQPVLPGHVEVKVRVNGRAAVP